MTTLQTCPACASDQASPFLDIPSTPVLCNVLCPTRDEALASPRARVTLAHCPSCGMMFNAAFDPAKIVYSGVYENALHFSPTFRQFADNLARDLVETHDIRNSTVVELGCGDASFLEALCRLGHNRGIGYDPAFDPARASIPSDADITIERTLFTRDTAPPAAALVCARHVLEHVQDPTHWLRGVRSALPRDNNTIVYMEVPCARYMLEKLAIWDILYEHCNYFAPPAMARAFAAAGFEVLRTENVYAAQFLSLRARPAAAPGHATIPNGADEEIARLVPHFARAHQAKVRDWSERLAEWRTLRRRAVLWGAGTKGVVFLNTIESGGSITHIVDQNPRKQGNYVVGSGQRIVAPEQLRDLKPDVVVVMNALYAKEIAERLASLGLSGVEVLVA